MKTNIEFELEAGLIQNRSMSIQFQCGNESIQIDQLPSGLSCYTMLVEWPAQLEIRVWGKNARDTVLDSDKKIIQDKFIRLANLKVNKMSVDPNWLPRFVTLLTDCGKTVASNYFGFNGRVLIDLGATPFQFVAGTYSQTKR